MVQKVFLRTGSLVQIFLSAILFIFIVACTSEERTDISSNEVEDLQTDYLLIGEWTATTVKPEDKLADKIYFSKNGDGKYIIGDKTGSLKWGTQNQYLVINLDNGSKRKSTYSIDGATLTLNEKQIYTLNTPILGEWYLNDLKPGQNVHSFAYNFAPSGTADYKYFDEKGALIHVGQMQWQRMENGNIRLKKDYQEKELSYQIIDDVLTLVDEGNFIKKNKWDFFGSWQSKYTEEGEIKGSQYPYNTFQMCLLNQKRHIVFSYVNTDGFENVNEFLWNEYNGIYLHLYFEDVEKMLFYRYKYNSTYRDIYLEISEYDDFRQHVGYLKTENYSLSY